MVVCLKYAFKTLINIISGSKGNRMALTIYFNQIILFSTGIMEKHCSLRKQDCFYCFRLFWHNYRVIFVYFAFVQPNFEFRKQKHEYFSCSPFCHVAPLFKTNHTIFAF